MSVLLVTSMGELVFDLFVDACPIACENFLKLCTIKYYHQCLFYNLQQNYLIQSGDPTGTGKGGNSFQGILQNNNRHPNQEIHYFKDELQTNLTLSTKIGYLGMSHVGEIADTNQSQFFITLRSEDMEHLKKQYTIFGELAEGLEVLIAMNELYCDEQGRPYQDVRILHTYILDDPFPNPKGLIIPDASPIREFPEEERVKPRIPWEPPRDPNDPSTLAITADGRTEDEILESIRRKEAKSRAIVLEMTGDLPDAEVKPPDEVLFVCKLNPITRDEDLELIFSRFGKIKSCEIIRDHKTGDSLNYAFIEFEKEDSCIEAYEKMNNALIDDRRIKVDFSQSVSKLWNRFLMKPRNTVKPLPPAVKKEEIKKQQPYQRKREDEGKIESKDNDRDQDRYGLNRDRKPVIKKEEYQRKEKSYDRRNQRNYHSNNNDREKRRSRSREDSRREKKDDNRKQDNDRRTRSKSREGERNKRDSSRDRDGQKDRDGHRERERVVENKNRDEKRGGDFRDNGHSRDQEKRDKDRSRRSYSNDRSNKRQKRSRSRSRSR